MVQLRSGKTTTYDSCRTQRCGHQCSALGHFKCCACEDTRPFHALYPSDKRDMFEPRRVKRNHYYCKTCKATTRSDRQPLAQRPPPEPVKIDFSRMKSKPASDPALFQPSPKPTPEWRIHILKTLNAELQKKYESSENTAVELRTEIRSLEAELEEMHDRLKGAVESIKYLTERIRHPSAISSPF